MEQLRTFPTRNPELRKILRTEAGYFERKTNASVRGANAIVTLRCTRLSRTFEDYWASRSRAV